MHWEAPVTLSEDCAAKMKWPFVRTMVECDVVRSTNDVAAQLVRAGALALPLVVWAHEQTQGRGRGSHEWWSDDGSLTFTIAIDPAAHGLSQLVLPRIAVATAVVVIDTVCELGFRDHGMGIRWPNDVECSGRKLAGILPETVKVSDVELLVVGVGLNVKTKLDDAPAEVRAMATSLEELSPAAIEAECSPRLLAAILERFKRMLGQLGSGDVSLAARWNELDALSEQVLRVDMGTQIVHGRGCGIDSDGALRVDDGRTTKRLFGGTVLR